jgi:predicted transcriptional regulator
MTIRVSPELKKKLDRIASATSRSRSFLAGEALAAYVDRELEIIDGIKRGMADAEAGRLVPHEEAMVEIFGLIRKAETGKGDKV